MARPPARSVEFRSSAKRSTTASAPANGRSVIFWGGARVNPARSENMGRQASSIATVLVLGAVVIILGPTSGATRLAVPAGHPATPGVATPATAPAAPAIPTAQAEVANAAATAIA